MHAFKYSRGQINCVGHYSKDGVKLRELIFPSNYNETEMFWLINSNQAYGGRSGLVPLLVLIIKGIVKRKTFPDRIFSEFCSDSATCKDKKFKIKRLYNLLRNGKKLDLKYMKSVNN
jgi:hypothetical protein